MKSINYCFQDKGFKKSKLSMQVFSTVMSFVATSGYLYADDSLKSEDKFSIEEVVVTARKREESLQDVAGSISALTEAQLDSRGVTDVKESVNIIPNVQMEVNSMDEPKVYIRGIGSSANNTGMESGVGFYVDEVFLPRPGLFNFNLADVQRIEVLRGPQGTVFGKNTIGGVISIHTQDPSFDYESKVTAKYGSDKYKTSEVRGYVNVPLIEDTTAMRLSLFNQNNNGFYENRSGDDHMSVDARGARLSLIHAPNDAFTLKASLDYSKDNNIDNVYDPVQGPVAAIDGNNGYDRSIATNEEDQSLRRTWGGTVRATYNSDDFEFVSISAFRQANNRSFNDQDYTVLDILATGRDTEFDYFSQEFRFVGDISETLRYVTGVYYSSTDLTSDQQVYLGTQFDDVFAGMDLGPYDMESIATHGLKTKSYAAFISFDKDLSDRLSLTAGIRYTEEDKTFSVVQTLDENIPILASTPGILTAQPLVKDELSEGAFSTDFSLSYDVTDSSIVYFKYARGFKSGGFDTTPIAVPVTGELSFDSETADSYELGMKSSWLEDRINLNLAVFRIDYKDKQEQVFNQTNFVTSNAGQARSEGAELEMIFALTRDLTLYANAGYLDAAYTEFDDGTIDRAGYRMPLAPRWSGSLAVDYSKDLNILSGAILNGRLEAIYASKSYNEINNIDLYSKKEHVIVNTRFGIDLEEYDASIYLWAKNLANEDYNVAGTNPLGLADMIALNAPRSFGIEVSKRF